eukprot:6186867-Pleurochrysis_carterae.AAC.6
MSLISTEQPMERKARTVGLQPVGDTLLVKPPGQLVVDADDEHVLDARALVGVDPLGELRLDRRVAHGHDHLAVDRRPPDNLAELLIALTVHRPRARVWRHDVVESARATRGCKRRRAIELGRRRWRRLGVHAPSHHLAVSYRHQRERRGAREELRCRRRAPETSRPTARQHSRRRLKGYGLSKSRENEVVSKLSQQMLSVGDCR